MQLFRGSTFSIKDLVSQFTNCVMIQNTREMGGYFGPDTHSATGNMKATHTTVRNMTQKFQSSEHKVLWTILFLVHNFK